jgi:hypothetical protein
MLRKCSNVPAGGGRIYDCLMKNTVTLAYDCRAQVPLAQQFMND